DLQPDTRTILFELQHVRNVIVHRLHLVDARFVKACPKLGYKKGARLMLKDEQVDAYFKASSDYAVALSRQVVKKWPKKKEAEAAPASPEPQREAQGN